MPALMWTSHIHDYKDFLANVEVACIPVVPYEEYHKPKQLNLVVFSGLRSNRVPPDWGEYT